MHTFVTNPNEHLFQVMKIIYLILLVKSATSPDQFCGCDLKWGEVERRRGEAWIGRSRGGRWAWGSLGRGVAHLLQAWEGLRGWEESVQGVGRRARAQWSVEGWARVPVQPDRLHVRVLQLREEGAGLRVPQSIKVKIYLVLIWKVEPPVLEDDFEIPGNWAGGARGWSHRCRREDPKSGEVAGAGRLAPSFQPWPWSSLGMCWLTSLSPNLLNLLRICLL